MDRHVLPVGRPVVLDEWGFLDLATATAWWVPPDDRPRPVTELYGQAASFVLLGADGTGKTVVLTGLRAREPEAVEVNLSVLGKAEMRRELADAAATGAPVYVDAVDSAARLEPAVYRILQERLAAAEAASVSWRLACRPTAWDTELASAFGSPVRPFQELRLLPLTRAAAVGVAAEEVSDPEGFLNALVTAGLGRLAASPMRLKSVARHWKDTGALTASQLDAIRFEVDHLLEDTSSRQPRSRVPTDRRRRLAGRLAAMTVFGKATRLNLDPRRLPGALHVGSLPSAAEADEPGRQVTQTEYEEVLETALFDAASDSAVAFRHQQYAEFLAAEYVTGRPITRVQLPVLLGMTGDGTIPGSLAGVAAWIAALSPELAGDFPAANALALAKTGVEFPPAYRAAIVDRVLAGAGSGTADLLPGQDLTTLAHAGLEVQLADRLGRGVNRPEEFWWISVLAAAGRCRELAGDLGRLLVASAWPAWARRAGLAALVALGDDQDLLRMKALARLPPESDPVDSVLADVIGALFPRLMGTGEALGVLRPQRNTGAVGPYYVLLDGLSARIPAADMPEALSWAAGRVDDGEDAFGSLLPLLVRRGWDYAGSPGVREPLARLTAGLASHPGWPRWPEQDDLPWLGQVSAERRELAVAVAAHLVPGDAYSLLKLGLLDPADLSWLLSELPRLAPPARDTVARCVSTLAQRPDAGAADLILGMDAGHPAYPYTRWLREPVSIDSEPARQWRRDRQRDAGHARQRETRARERSARLMAAVDDAARDPGSWWLVGRWLAADDIDNPEAVFSHDLTARPGWDLLTESQRRDVIDLGVRFLTLHRPEPSNWAGRATVPADLADPDWQGVYLLTTLASRDQARLEFLGTAVWQAWAPAIVGAWCPATEDDVQARCRLVDLMPPGTQEAIAAAALAHLDAIQEHGAYPQPYGLYAHLCPSLAPGLADRLLDGTYRDSHARVVLGMLIKHAPVTAVTVCRQIAFTPGADLAADARRGLAALSPAVLVEDLHANGTAPGEIAELAPHFDVSRLNDSELIMLGRMLLDCVPFSGDPPVRFGVFTPEPGYAARRKRDLVLATLADRGQARFFEELARDPDPAGRQTVTWHLRQARSRAIDISYPGLPPDQMLHLLGRADARLVRHDDDLLEAVVAGLDELQIELAQLHQYQFLWDNPGPDGSPKDEDVISDWVRQKLQARLQNAFFQREAHVASKGRGIGTRIDIEATVTTATHPPGKARVIAEAKLVTHRDLMTALPDQLVRRYMIPTGIRRGLYLVYWTEPGRGRHKGPRDRATLVQALAEQAARACDLGVEVSVYVLDISYS